MTEMLKKDSAHKVMVDFDAGVEEASKPRVAPVAPV